jgi:hypothetical protein
MISFTEMFGYDIANDPFNLGEVVYPRYLVWSVLIGSAYYEAQSAIDWCTYMEASGVETTIYDLTDYDWIANPVGLRVNNIADTLKQTSLH